MRSKKSMISVIIPTYNRAHLLPRAIKSVLKQTYQDFELFVVDDGSTDKTKEVVQSYVEHDKRVQYMYKEHSGGAAGPKNEGIKKAKGDYIAVLDSDDEWLPEKLEFQLRLFREQGGENLKAVGCDIVVVNSATKKEQKYRIPRFRNAFRELLLRDYMGPGSCMLYAREVFGQVGLFDEQLTSGQDRDMRARILEKYDIAFANAYLVRYYTGHKNVSIRPRNILEKNRMYFFEKYKQYYLHDSRLWSEKLRYDGTRYVLLGEVGMGRKLFFKSLQKNPLNIKSVASFIISLFGRKIYEVAAKIKMAAGNI